VSDTAKAVVRHDIVADRVEILLRRRDGQAVSFPPVDIVRYDPEGVEPSPEVSPLRLTEDEARAMYEALGRFFGSDAVSNDRLRSDYVAERSRVDRMINHLIGSR